MKKISKPTLSRFFQDNNISPDSCVIASLQLPAIQTAKKIDPEYRTLYIMTVALGDCED